MYRIFDLDHLGRTASDTVYWGPAEQMAISTGRTLGIIDVSNLARIENDPNYQELVRRRSSLGWMLTLIMLVT